MESFSRHLNCCMHSTLAPHCGLSHASQWKIKIKMTARPNVYKIQDVSAPNSPRKANHRLLRQLSILTLLQTAKNDLDVRQTYAVGTSSGVSCRFRSSHAYMHVSSENSNAGLRRTTDVVTFSLSATGIHITAPANKLPCKNLHELEGARA
jgi:hypothetical protein